MQQICVFELQTIFCSYSLSFKCMQTWEAAGAIVIQNSNSCTWEGKYSANDPETFWILHTGFWSGSFLLFLFPTPGKTLICQNGFSIKFHWHSKAAHSFVHHHIRRTKRSRSAQRAHYTAAFNQILQPISGLLKCFGGDVSTWVPQLLLLSSLSLLQFPQKEGASGLGGIGRSLEGVCREHLLRVTAVAQSPETELLICIYLLKVKILAYLLSQTFSCPRAWNGETTWECKNSLTACSELLTFNLQTKAGFVSTLCLHAGMVPGLPFFAPHMLQPDLLSLLRFWLCWNFV